MDIAQILGQLWKRRGLLALAALLAVVIGISLAYRVSVSPLGFQKKSLELGSASTRLLIDTQRSSVLDVSGDLTSLSARAQTYASVASSEPVLAALAREVGIPRAALIADPGLIDQGKQGAPARSEEILKETGVYRVSYNTTQEQPLLQVSTQAPTGPAAVKLANGAARALRGYVVRQQVQQNVPAGRRVTIRQLGGAQGGVINSGANLAAALLGGLTIFVGACLLILFGDRLRADLRRRRGGLYHGQSAVSSLAEVRGGSDQEAREVEAWRVDLDSDAVRDRHKARSGA